MDAEKVKEIQNMIKNHKNSVSANTPREVPVGAGRPSDDLSKVMTNDVIGKGGESDLQK